jgi:hypothetical protein
LTNDVVRGEPSKSTTEEELKFVPFTVSVNEAEFCALVLGEMLVVVGTGLLTVNGALSPGAGIGCDVEPLGLRLAVMTTPVSAFEYVTPLIVTWFVPPAIVPPVVPPSVPVPVLTVSETTSVWPPPMFAGLPMASCAWTVTEKPAPASGPLGPSTDVMASFATAPALTVMDGLVLEFFVLSVTSVAVIVWLPAVFSVTLRVPVPVTRAESAGSVAFESLDEIETVSVTVLTTFQLASTALTVTLNAVPDA